MRRGSVVPVPYVSTKNPLSGALCLVVVDTHLFHFLVHLSQTRPTQMSNMRSTVIIYYPNAS